MSALRQSIGLAACLSLLLAPVFAGKAQAGGTVYRATGCGEYIFVVTGTGYSVLRTDGGSGVKDGDELTGDVEQIGQATLYDSTAGRTVFAQIGDRHLTRAEVAPRVAVACRAPLGDTLTSGYVSRTTGCGSRIFVNTSQGYAVLERLSGGIVDDGDTLRGNFNRPGQATVTDAQTGSQLVVFVADLWLSRTAAEHKMAASCQGAGRAVH